MPKYRLMAGVSWIAGSDHDLGIAEYETEDQAAQAAYDAACEYLDAWAELVEDGQDGEA